MSSKTDKKQFAQDFKSAIEIVELPIPEPTPDEKGEKKEPQILPLFSLLYIEY